MVRCPSFNGLVFQPHSHQNPGTGNPGTDGGCATDAEELGVDFLLDMGADLGMDARLVGSSGCRAFDEAMTVPNAVLFVADGMDAVVPLAMLGSDDGLLNFKVTMSELIEGLDGFTGILDVMPDTGERVGTSALDGGPPAGGLTITGVFNAATSVPEGQPGHAASPGSAVAVFGEGFASHLASPSPVPLNSQQIPLDTTLGDLTATVDGIPMPLFGVFRGEDSGAGFRSVQRAAPLGTAGRPEGSDGDASHHQQWRFQRAAGNLVGPRLSGPLFVAVRPRPRHRDELYTGRPGAG